MTTRQQKIRRRQLDRQLLSLVPVIPSQPPKGGWIRAIREALGMTLDSLSKRIGVTKQTAAQLERAEVDGSATIARLRAAANSLECDLAVILIPRKSFEAIIEDNAAKAAHKLMKKVTHTMSLEAQGVEASAVEDMLRETIDDLVARGDQRIWQ